LTSAQSPTVRRRRLAAELRRLREATGMTCEEAADRLECSASKISRVETGRVSVTPRDVRDLLEIYGAPGELTEALISLARESRQKGWWHAYGDSVQPHFAMYLGMESEASEIRVYAVSRIPGLLQTADYARAVAVAELVQRPSANLDRSVAMMAERRRLANSKGPKIWAVLDEAAVRRHVGGPEVMRAQLEYLLEVGTRPGISVQVIPFSGGAHPGMGRPFTILAFPEPVDPDVVHVTGLTSGLWLEDMADVHTYNMFFNHLCATALSFDDSAALIMAALKEL
jgi:transcriptional regulator with XRE-family HTH domain